MNNEDENKEEEEENEDFIGLTSEDFDNASREKYLKKVKLIQDVYLPTIQSLLSKMSKDADMYPVHFYKKLQALYNMFTKPKKKLTYASLIRCEKLLKGLTRKIKDSKKSINEPAGVSGADPSNTSEPSTSRAGQPEECNTTMNRFLIGDDSENEKRTSSEGESGTKPRIAFKIKNKKLGNMAHEVFCKSSKENKRRRSSGSSKDTGTGFRYKPPQISESNAFDDALYGHVPIKKPPKPSTPKKQSYQSEDWYRRQSSESQGPRWSTEELDVETIHRADSSKALRTFFKPNELSNYNSPRYKYHEPRPRSYDSQFKNYKDHNPNYSSRICHSLERPRFEGSVSYPLPRYRHPIPHHRSRYSTFENDHSRPRFKVQPDISQYNRATFRPVQPPSPTFISDDDLRMRLTEKRSLIEEEEEKYEWVRSVRTESVESLEIHERIVRYNEGGSRRSRRDSYGESSRTSHDDQHSVAYDQQESYQHSIEYEESFTGSSAGKSNRKTKKKKEKASWTSSYQNASLTSSSERSQIKKEKIEKSTFQKIKRKKNKERVVPDVLKMKKDDDSVHPSYEPILDIEKSLSTDLDINYETFDIEPMAAAEINEKTQQIEALLSVRSASISKRNSAVFKSTTTVESPTEIDDEREKSSHTVTKPLENETTTRTFEDGDENLTAQEYLNKTMASLVKDRRPPFRQYQTEVRRDNVTREGMLGNNNSAKDKKSKITGEDKTISNDKQNNASTGSMFIQEQSNSSSTLEKQTIDDNKNSPSPLFSGKKENYLPFLNDDHVINENVNFQNKFEVKKSSEQTSFYNEARNKNCILEVSQNQSHNSMELKYKASFPFNEQPGLPALDNRNINMTTLDSKNNDKNFFEPSNEQPVPLQSILNETETLLKEECIEQVTNNNRGSSASIPSTYREPSISLLQKTVEPSKISNESVPLPLQPTHYELKLALPEKLEPPLNLFMQDNKLEPINSQRSQENNESNKSNQRLRDKLSEDINTLHKVGTSTGGALRSLKQDINKDKMMPPGRIASLKPGALFDLIGESQRSNIKQKSRQNTHKNVTSNTSDSTSNNFSKASDIISQMSESELQKLVNENLEKLPLPPDISFLNCSNTNSNNLINTGLKNNVLPYVYNVPKSEIDNNSQALEYGAPRNSFCNQSVLPNSHLNTHKINDLRSSIFSVKRNETQFQEFQTHTNKLAINNYPANETQERNLSNFSSYKPLKLHTDPLKSPCYDGSATPDPYRVDPYTLNLKGNQESEEKIMFQSQTVSLQSANSMLGHPSSHQTALTIEKPTLLSSPSLQGPIPSIQTSRLPTPSNSCALPTPSMFIQSRQPLSCGPMHPEGNTHSNIMNQTMPYAYQQFYQERFPRPTHVVTDSHCNSYRAWKAQKNTSERQLNSQSFYDRKPNARAGYEQYRWSQLSGQYEQHNIQVGSTFSNNGGLRPPHSQNEPTKKLSSRDPRRKSIDDNQRQVESSNSNLQNIDHFKTSLPNMKFIDDTTSRGREEISPSRNQEQTRENLPFRSSQRTISPQRDQLGIRKERERTPVKYRSPSKKFSSWDRPSRSRRRRRSHSPSPSRLNYSKRESSAGRQNRMRSSKQGGKDDYSSASKNKYGYEREERSTKAYNKRDFGLQNFKIPKIKRPSCDNLSALNHDELADGQTDHSIRNENATKSMTNDLKRTETGATEVENSGNCLINQVCGSKTDKTSSKDKLVEEKVKPIDNCNIDSAVSQVILKNQEIQDIKENKQISELSNSPQPNVVSADSHFKTVTSPNAEEKVSSPCRRSKRIQKSIGNMSKESFQFTVRKEHKENHCKANEDCSNNKEKLVKQEVSDDFTIDKDCNVPLSSNIIKDNLNSDSHETNDLTSIKHQKDTTNTISNISKELNSNMPCADMCSSSVNQSAKVTLEQPLLGEQTTPTTRTMPSINKSLENTAQCSNQNVTSLNLSNLEDKKEKFHFSDESVRDLSTIEKEDGELSESKNMSKQIANEVLENMNLTKGKSKADLTPEDIKNIFGIEISLEDLKKYVSGIIPTSEQKIDSQPASDCQQKAIDTKNNQGEHVMSSNASSSERELQNQDDTKNNQGEHVMSSNASSSKRELQNQADTKYDACSKEVIEDSNKPKPDAPVDLPLSNSEANMFSGHIIKKTKKTTKAKKFKGKKKPLLKNPKNQALPKEKKLTKSKKNELDRLQDDISKYHDSEAIVSASGPRMCRLQKEKQYLSNTQITAQNSPQSLDNKKSAAKKGHEVNKRSQSLNRKSLSDHENGEDGDDSDQPDDSQIYSDDSDNFTLDSNLEKLKSKYLPVIQDHEKKKERERILREEAAKLENVPPQTKGQAVNSSMLQETETSSVNGDNRTGKEISHLKEKESNTLATEIATQNGSQNTDTTSSSHESLEELKNTNSSTEIAEECIPLNKEVDGTKNAASDELLAKNISESEDSESEDEDNDMDSSDVYDISNDPELSSKNYFQQGESKVRKCKLCPYKGKAIVSHYTNTHPRDEVLISRMSLKTADKAVKESNLYFKLQVKNSRKGFQCRICDQSFYKFTVFFEHMTVHTGEYRHECCKCGHRTSTRTGIIKHISSAHSGKENRKMCRVTYKEPSDKTYCCGYLCSLCNYFQLSQINVKRHLECSHNSEDFSLVIKLNLSKLNYKKSAYTVINDLRNTSEATVKNTDEKEALVEKTLTPTPQMEEKTVFSNISSQFQSSADLVVKQESSEEYDEIINSSSCDTVNDKHKGSTSSEQTSVPHEGCPNSSEITSFKSMNEVSTFNIKSESSSIFDESEGTCLEDLAEECIELLKLPCQNELQNEKEHPCSNLKNENEIKKEDKSPYKKDVPCTILGEVGQFEQTLTVTDMQRSEEEKMVAYKRKCDEIYSSISIKKVMCSQEILERLVSKFRELETTLDESIGLEELVGKNVKENLDINLEDSRQIDKEKLEIACDSSEELDRQMLPERISNSATKSKSNDDVPISSSEEASVEEFMQRLLASVSDSEDEMGIEEQDINYGSNSCYQAPVLYENLIGRCQNMIVNSKKYEPKLEPYQSSLPLNSNISEFTFVMKNLLQNPQKPMLKTKVTVGGLTASPRDDAVIFRCSVAVFKKPCEFQTQSLLELGQHVNESHHSNNWDGACGECFVVFTPDPESHDKSAVNTQSRAFCHLVLKHLDLEFRSCDGQIFVSKEGNALKGTTEVVSPAKPLLRVRRLSGDFLSGDNHNILKSPLIEVVADDKDSSSLSVHQTGSQQTTVGSVVVSRPSVIQMRPQHKTTSLLPACNPVYPTNTGNVQSAVASTSSVKQYKYVPMSTVANYKTPEAYRKMLTPFKLGHLYKCMGADCYFTSQDGQAFIKHYHQHVLLSQTNPIGDIHEWYWMLCSYCFSKHESSKELCVHIRKEHGCSKFQCAFCFYRAKTSTNLNIHNNEEHKNVALCILECQHEGELTEPIEKPWTDFVRILQCCKDNCDLITYMYYRFEDHITNEHNTDLKCHICFQSQPSPKKYLEHLLEKHHTGPIQCYYCKFATNEDVVIRLHLCYSHPNATPKSIFRVSSPAVPQEDENGQGSMREKMRRILYHKDEERYRQFIIPAPTVQVEEIAPANPVLITTVPQFKKVVIPQLQPGEVFHIGPDVTVRSGMPSIPTQVNSFAPKIVSVESIAKVTSPSTPSFVQTLCNTTPAEGHPVIVLSSSESSDTSSSLTDDHQSTSSHSNTVDLCSTLESSSQEFTEVSEAENDPLSSGDSQESRALVEHTTKISLSERKFQEPIPYFTCGNERCSFKGFTRADLRKHMKGCKEGKVNSPFLCSYCKRTFRQSLGVIEHQRIHGPDRFFCSLCDFQGPIYTKVSSHMKTAHQKMNTKVKPIDSSKTDEDKDCFQVIPIEVLLDIVRPRNEKQVSKKKEKSLENKNKFRPGDLELIPQTWLFAAPKGCQLCSYETKVRSNLIRHLIQHEQGSTVAQEEVVNPVPEKKDKEFDKMMNLASSSQKKKEVEPANASTDCPYKYVPDNLRYACNMEDCTYLTLNETMLRNHISVLHKDSLFYRCKHCDVSVIIPVDTVGQHLKLHDCPLFKCNYCTYCSSLKRKIEKHLQTEHEEQEPIVITIRINKPSEEEATPAPQASPEKPGGEDFFKCLICDYKVSKKKLMLNHGATDHNFEKPLKCVECEYKASNDHFMKLHFKSTHPEKETDFICFFEVVRETTNVERVKQIHYQPLWTKKNKRDPNHIRGIHLQQSGEILAPLQTGINVNVNNLHVLELKFGRFGEPTYKGQYICPRCSHTANTQQEIREHLFRELEYFPVSCKSCSYGSTQRTKVIKHVTKSHNVDSSNVSSCIDITSNPEIEEWVDKVISTQQEKMKELPPIPQVSSDSGNALPETVTAATCSRGRKRRISVELDSQKSSCSVPKISRVELESESVPVQEATSPVVESETEMMPMVVTVFSLAQSNETLPENVDQEVPGVSDVPLTQSSDEGEEWKPTGKKAKRERCSSAHRFGCGYCSVTTKFKQSIFSHSKKMHPDLAIKVRTLDKPPTIHINTCGYLCAHCPCIGLKASDFREHWTEEHKAHGLAHSYKKVKLHPDLEYMCYHCKNRSDIISLIEHCKSDHTNRGILMITVTIPKFKCAECDLVFNSVAILQRHFSMDHPSKTFNYNVIQTQKLVPLTKEKQPKRISYKCFICHFVSSLYASMVKHLSRHLVTFICKSCNQTFNNSAAVRCHMTTAHPGMDIRPHVIQGSDKEIENAKRRILVVSELGRRNITEEELTRAEKEIELQGQSFSTDECFSPVKETARKSTSSPKKPKQKVASPKLSYKRVKRKRNISGLFVSLKSCNRLVKMPVPTITKLFNFQPSLLSKQVANSST